MTQIVILDQKISNMGSLCYKLVIVDQILQKSGVFERQSKILRGFQGRSELKRGVFLKRA